MSPPLCPRPSSVSLSNFAMRISASVHTVTSISLLVANISPIVYTATMPDVPFKPIQIDDANYWLTVSGSPTSMNTGITNNECTVTFVESPVSSISSLFALRSQVSSRDSSPYGSIAEAVQLRIPPPNVPNYQPRRAGLCIDPDPFMTKPMNTCDGCTAQGDWDENQIQCEFPGDPELSTVKRVIYNAPMGSLVDKYQDLVRRCTEEKGIGFFAKILRAGIAIITFKPLPVSLIQLEEARETEAKRLNDEVAPRICGAVRDHVSWPRVRQLAERTRMKVLERAESQLGQLRSKNARKGPVGESSPGGYGGEGPMQPDSNQTLTSIYLL